VVRWDGDDDGDDDAIPGTVVACDVRRLWFIERMRRLTDLQADVGVDRVTGGQMVRLVGVMCVGSGWVAALYRDTLYSNGQLIAVSRTLSSHRPTIIHPFMVIAEHFHDDLRGRWWRGEMNF
jgi:hypothetical protein